MFKKRPRPEPLAAPEPGCPAIEVRGLTKRFGEHTVLEDLDLQVPAGKTLAILGFSGSGKSTLLRCLIGLEEPDAGEIKLHGVDMDHANADQLQRLRERMGVAFQGGALFGSMTVGENVDLPLAEHTDLPHSTRRLVVRMKLAMVGLEHATDLYPAELSGGMLKRAALARAMVLDPDLLFCDEPSAGLDPVTSAGLDELLKSLRDVFGATLVVVTHELESAFRIADYIGVMYKGKFLTIAPPEELKNSTDERVRAFLDRKPPKEKRDEGWYNKMLTEISGEKRMPT